MNSIQSVSSVKKEPEAMSFWELIEEHAALTKTIPLLDPKSKEIAIADFATITKLRSIKWDQLYIVMKELEKNITSFKEEEKELSKERKSKEDQLADLKVSIRQIRRNLPMDKEHDTFSGKFSQFKVTAITPGQPYSLKIIATKDHSEFSKEDQEKFFIQKEIRTIEKIVLTSISGKEINTISSVPKIKSQIILNEDVIIHAYKNREQLPHGIRVIQNYRITRKRICSEMDLEASSYTKQFLRESSSSN